MFAVAFLLAAGQTVSCSVDPVSASIGIPQLGRACGIVMRTEGEIGNDIVTVQVSHAPLNDLLARVARVTYGEWRRSGESYVLARSPSAVRKAQEQEHRRKAADLDKRLEPFSRELRETYDKARVDAILKDLTETATRNDGNSWTRLRNLELEDPVLRLMGRLLLYVEQERLLNLRQGQTIAFSTEPSRGRIPLGDVEEMFETLEQEQKVVLQARPASPDPMGEDSLGFVYRPWGWSGTFSKRPKNAELVVHSYAGGDLLCTLILRDRENRVMVTCNQSLVVSKPSLERRMTNLVELRPASKALRIESEDVPETGLPSPLRTALKPWLVDSVHHDPLSLLIPEAFESIRSSGKEQIVGDLPDSAYAAAEGAHEEGRISGQAMLGQLKDLSDAMVRDEGGWLEISPRDPSECSALRMDRKVLGSVLRRVTESDDATYDDYIDLAGAVKSMPAGSPILVDEIELLTGLRISRNAEWRIYSLLATLSKSARKRLLSGSKLAYASMPKEAEPMIRELTSDWISNFTDTKSAGDGQEPGIVAQRKRTPVMRLYDKANPDAPYWWVTLNSQGGFAWGGPPLVVPDNGLDGTLCRPFVDDRMEVTLDLPDGGRRVFYVNLHTRISDPKKIAYASLPAATRQAIKTNYDLVPKMTKDGKELPGGRG